MAENTSISVLMIGHVWPEVTSSAAGVRELGLVRGFLKKGWRVFYVSPSKNNDHRVSLDLLGVETAQFEPNDSGFDTWLSQIQPDFVIFDRFMIEEQFSFRVREVCPDAVRVLDTIDLHLLRRFRQQNPDPQAVQTPLWDSEDASRELASIFRSDLSLILSDSEVQLLRSSLGLPESLLQESLELCRIFYNSPPAQTPGFSERQHFSMIGNFRHAPNADAVLWLKKEIWPAIRGLLPNAEVHVYGAYPPKEMMDLTDAKTGFYVKGWTPDACGTLAQYRVNLAPLRFGAGIKGKILDGWWAGTPPVTTSIGAEGMTGLLPWGGLVADTAEAFAKGAVQLYQSPDLWADAVRKGRGILNQEYDFDSQSTRLVEKLLEVRSELQGRRARNWAGAMLWHHLHKSTTYFSRWIEAKNRPASSQIQ